MKYRVIRCKGVGFFMWIIVYLWFYEVRERERIRENKREKDIGERGREKIVRLNGFNCIIWFYLKF